MSSPPQLRLDSLGKFPSSPRAGRHRVHTYKARKSHVARMDLISTNQTSASERPVVVISEGDGPPRKEGLAEGVGRERVSARSPVNIST